MKLSTILNEVQASYGFPALLSNAFDDGAPGGGGHDSQPESERTPDAAAGLKFIEVLPKGGKLCVAYGTTPNQHKWFNTPAEVEQFSQQDRPGETIWFAFASYDTEAGGRTQANVLRLKSFLHDIDVGPNDPNKYATQDEAWEALVKLADDGVVPVPTFVVNSGNGYHPWWLPEFDMSPQEWRQYAERLKLAIKRADPKLIADSKRITDSASLMRWPGTFNKKNGTSKPVTLEHVGDYVTLEQLDAMLPAAKATVIRPGVTGKTNNLGGNRDKRPDPDILPVMENCKAIQYYRNELQDVASYQQWWPLIQLSAFCSNPEYGAVLFSEGLRYNEPEASKLLKAAIRARGEGKIGPYTCEKLCEDLDFDRAGCAGCPMAANEHGSPINLMSMLSAETLPKMEAELDAADEAKARAQAGQSPIVAQPIEPEAAATPAPMAEPVSTPSVSTGEAAKAGKTETAEKAEKKQRKQRVTEEVVDMHSRNILPVVEGGDQKWWIMDKRILVKNPALKRMIGEGAVYGLCLKMRKDDTINHGFTCDLSKPYGAIVTNSLGERYINTFAGFTTVAKPGPDVSIFRNYIREVLAAGNQQHADYIEWLSAWCWQNKAKAPNVALVFRSREEGTGKSTFGELGGKLFAPAATSSAKAKAVTGQFNSALEGVRVLTANEAFFAGDPSQRAALYDMITSPTLEIERKFRDRYTVPNFLWMIITTNSDWAVPAGATARRFAVFDVSDVRIGDKAYWDVLYAAIEDPAMIAAWAHYLEGVKLGNWHPRNHIPQTAALMEQKLFSGDATPEGFIRKCLERGLLRGDDADATPSANSASRRGRCCLSRTPTRGICGRPRASCSTRRP